MPRPSIDERIKRSLEHARVTHPHLDPIDFIGYEHVDSARKRLQRIREPNPTPKMMKDFKDMAEKPLSLFYKSKVRAREVLNNASPWDLQSLTECFVVVEYPTGNLASIDREQTRPRLIEWLNSRGVNQAPTIGEDSVHKSTSSARPFAQPGGLPHPFARSVLGMEIEEDDDEVIFVSSRPKQQPEHEQPSVDPAQSYNQSTHPARHTSQAPTPIVSKDRFGRVGWNITPNAQPANAPSAEVSKLTQPASSDEHPRDNDLFLTSEQQSADEHHSAAQIRPEVTALAKDRSVPRPMRLNTTDAPGLKSHRPASATPHKTPGVETGRPLTSFLVIYRHCSRATPQAGNAPRHGVGERNRRLFDTCGKDIDYIFLEPPVREEEYRLYTNVKQAIGPDGKVGQDIFVPRCFLELWLKVKPGRLKFPLRADVRVGDNGTPYWPTVPGNAETASEPMYQPRDNAAISKRPGGIGSIAKPLSRRLSNDEPHGDAEQPSSKKAKTMPASDLHRRMREHMGRNSQRSNERSSINGHLTHYIRAPNLFEVVKAEIQAFAAGGEPRTDIKEKLAKALEGWYNLGDKPPGGFGKRVGHLE